MAAKGSRIDFMFLALPYPAAGSTTAIHNKKSVSDSWFPGTTQRQADDHVIMPHVTLNETWDCKHQQECIPVGCVPTVAEAISSGHSHLYHTAFYTAPLLPWTEWQTPVKTLLSPILRMRSANIRNYLKMGSLRYNLTAEKVCSCAETVLLIMIGVKFGNKLVHEYDKYIYFLDLSTSSIRFIYVITVSLFLHYNIARVVDWNGWFL